jgi:hypothetical protein
MTVVPAGTPGNCPGCATISTGPVCRNLRKCGCSYHAWLIWGTQHTSQQIKTRRCAHSTASFTRGQRKSRTCRCRVHIRIQNTQQITTNRTGNTMPGMYRHDIEGDAENWFRKRAPSRETRGLGFDLSEVRRANTIPSTCIKPDQRPCTVHAD